MDATRLLLILAVVVVLTVTNLLPRAHPSEQLFQSYKRMVAEKDTARRQDLLGAISNPVKGRDAYLYSLWEQYKNSSTSKRPITQKDMHDAFKKIAYLDSRIKLIGWMLYGPEKYHSMLHSTREKKHPTLDDPHCVKSNLKTFEKHCGVVIKNDMKQFVENLCNYVMKREAIHEAIILACSTQSPKSHAIDVTNREIDITPAPIHGTFEYCGRVSINGIPKTKLKNQSNTYQVTVLPKSIIDERYPMIHICFHGNDSRGMCQCEKDDWTYIEKELWSSRMLPYEKMYVDVKFIARINGFVTVSLSEVPSAEGCCSGLLVAVGSLLALGCVIVCILPPLLSKTKLWLRGHRQGTSPINGPLRSQLTEQFVGDMVSSPEFKAWMIKNAHRIKICPDNE